MGGFTIYCPISGLPLEVSFDYEINNNDIKYGHLNEAIVILPDGKITDIGSHDGYGRIETDDEIFSCHDEEDKTYRYGIAISHCVYKLMLLNPKFQDFMNNTKNLFDYIKSYCNRIDSPVMNYNGAQYLHLVDISQKDIPYFVDPFLEEKIEEPLLGTTPKRGTRKIDGKKNKELLNKIIDNFLDFIPKTKEEKSNNFREFMLESQIRMMESSGISTISEEKQKKINQLIEDNMKEFKQMNIK
jgi:hypothetical protein